MISKRALARALALCDAGNLRLPVLEVSLARGLVCGLFPASDIPKQSAIVSQTPAESFSSLAGRQSSDTATHDRVTSLIQSRHYSSEEAFREYGRNFGDGGGSVSGTGVADEEFAGAAFPEGLGEEEYMNDDEQHESEDEIEMRIQLLKAALSHVVSQRSLIWRMPITCCIVQTRKAVLAGQGIGMS